ncbi:HAMP domain-containing histidine kinase [Sphingobacterium psychroaquaticum]|uniref:sensor histidine kinase n=1 Tax=Sphingobacterium psychroaquaticum TaxID=561061 RepID=UPI001069D702|nr:HAMP domain-containing sensor histidine kinase [Sphingobacterium psychroaquaticum]QBQ40170.1 HAMP domain-containing histidine kinase [Sphingobacterium psychroaquaticum]
MKLLTPTRLLKIVVSVCFLILLGLQYKLISGVYEAKRNELFRVKMGEIKQAYNRSIINDKLFPGGQAIIDNYLNKDKVGELAVVFHRNEDAFVMTADSIYESIVQDLRGKSNIDSVLQAIQKEINLDSIPIRYALVLNSLSTTFDGQVYHDLASSANPYGHDVLISGSSTLIKESNLVSAFTVSSPTAFSNRVEFTFYANRESLTWATFVAILPLLALSGICILVMIFVFYFTIHHWAKQKKLTEMSTDFVNSITHEFKTPISTIKVCVKNLQRELNATTGNDKFSDGFKVIERQSERLNKLIDQAIHTSVFNLSQTKKEWRLVEEDVYILLKDLKLKYAHEADVCIQTGSLETNSFVRYDPFLFTTAVSNIIQNGIKHNSSPVKNIHVDSQIEGDRLVLRFRDNGDGIPKEEESKIFDQFYQGKAGKKNGGLGLGLFYVRKLLDLHDWKIKIESAVQKGTVISISIPVN